MSDSAIKRKTRSRWYLRADHLYDDKERQVDWHTFLPKIGGTKHQRTYLLKSCKGALEAIIGTPRKTQRKGPALSTIFVWVSFLRRLTRWMTAKNIWRFSSLTGDDVSEYVESCSESIRTRTHSRNTVQTIEQHVQFLVELWSLRSQYVGGLRINPATLDVVWTKHGRKNMPWKALEEGVALPLIGDAANWLRSYGDYLISVRKRRWAFDRQLVGCTRGKRKELTTSFYRKLEQDPEMKDLRTVLNMHGDDTFRVLHRAFVITDGACFNLMLFIVGMRVSELARLDVGCIKSEQTGDGTTVLRLEGVAAKKGAVHRKWIATDEVATVVDYMERSFADVRDATGAKALVFNTGYGVAFRMRKPSRVGTGVIGQRMRLFAYAPERRVLVNQHLHPHVARKTFARFVVTRDKHSLEALAHHYGHVYQSITDGRYVGSDIELRTLLAEESRRDLEHALTDLVTSSRLGGKAGAALKETCRTVESRFRGKKGVQRMIEKLIADGVRLAPCDWGYCVYSEALSACKGDARGPNEARRSPDVCAGCRNFTVTERHQAWWEARLDRDSKFLERKQLPEQTIAWVKQRRLRTAAILADIIKLPDRARNDNVSNHDANRTT
jgi:integrase